MFPHQNQLDKQRLVESGEGIKRQKIQILDLKNFILSKKSQINIRDRRKQDNHDSIHRIIFRYIDWKIKLANV